MSGVTQKCQYALRAVFELALRQADEPFVGVTEIAEAQDIPQRFLELILNQLRQAGFVTSRRGQRGGYTLAADPAKLTVGDIIRCMDGPIHPVKCISEDGGHEKCPLRGRCAFTGLWSRARDAIAGVYDATTFKELVDEHRASKGKHVLDYCI